MTNTDKTLIGIVIVGGIIFLATRPKADVTNTTTDLPVTDPTGATIQVPTPVIVKPLDGNLILKIGSKNLETKKLQELLGIYADGIFGANTEKTLLAKKGVKNITLNEFPTIKLNASNLKSGDLVQAKNISGATLYKDEFKNGMHYNTGIVDDYIGYTFNIGRIVNFNQDRTKAVLFMDTFGFKKNVWVNTNDIELA